SRNTRRAWACGSNASRSNLYLRARRALPHELTENLLATHRKHVPHRKSDVEPSPNLVLQAALEIGHVAKCPERKAGVKGPWQEVLIHTAVSQSKIDKRTYPVEVGIDMI